ncbi:metal-dependent hydrolase [Myxococcus sp. CA051A]|uniref:metal-dependent hydrolase n=1 Tax=unclassified Myxococcus TaxID=2648731 RepID=UPI00157A3021|nr:MULTISPECIES: metal-dependent hydrolase [unclassified Myxococcus]NTX09246.1 metal-dependent hydrolase [Myxococcus sp. CA056]NTX61335.1 metal-dependent hydrolase [Myxococcus sp. CA051A]
MDNLAHSLVGAWMAEAGLKRYTPLATATLVIGANLPDVDAVFALAGSDASLYWRRGWTHGVLALSLWPFVLTGLMLLWDRFVRRRRRPDLAPARVGPLLLLSTVSVLSHPALDWLNTYGVRLLMPFDGTWFYGDTLFIVDPWVWLLAGAAVIMADARTRKSVAGWLVLGVATTALVTIPGFVPWPAKVLWAVGVAAILWLRLKGTQVVSTQRVATVCGVGLVLYLGAILLGSQVAAPRAQEWLKARGHSVERVIAGPVPANPFVRDLIALGPDRYHFVRADFLRGGDEHLEMSGPTLPREPNPGPVIQAALAAPHLRGLANWLRLPTYQVAQTEAGWRVTIDDVRYSRSQSGGLGSAVVELDKELRLVKRPTVE